MTKCLKPDFCKLKKEQCIRCSATCWAQRVDTQVDWPNSFWDMTKCLKPYFCKLKKQQCIRRSAACWAQRVYRCSATCWAQRVDTPVDWPNSFWDMTKCLKPYFLQIEETTVYSARRYLLRTSVDTQVDWPNSFWDMTKCLKPFLQIEAVYSVDLLSTTQVRSIGQIVSEIWQNV